MADIAKAGLSRTEGTKPDSAKPGQSQKAGSRPDIATIGGIVLALGGIVGGLLMEGGRIEDISQITAAFIVLGGTLGAVMVSTPMSVLKGAMLRLIHVLRDKTQLPDAAIEELIGYAPRPAGMDWSRSKPRLWGSRIRF